MTPVLTFGDYVVTFEAEPEEVPLNKHFKDCGWTPNEIRKLRGSAWFSAKVCIFKDAEELATEYLGCCCYKTSKEFYTTYRGDYFADMVLACAEQIGDPVLIQQVKASLR